MHRADEYVDVDMEEVWTEIESGQRVRIRIFAVFITWWPDSVRDRTRIFFVCFFFQATGEVPETADIINNIIEMAGIDEDNAEVDEDAAIPEPPAPTHAEFYAAMNIVRSYNEKHQLALAPWR